MFDIKTIVTSLVVSVLVVVGAGMVSDNQTDNAPLGALSRMPNTDFVARSVTASTTSTTATSTISVMGASATQGGQIIVKDTDALGCSSIAALNGTVISRTITCP